MNVAIICNKGFGTDGISWFITNNYKKFSDSSIHYHLVFPQYIGDCESVEKVLRNFHREGTSIKCIPKDKGLIRFAYQLRKYLKEQNVDVVHIHGSSAGVALETLISKSVGLSKVITHSHSSGGNHQIIHKMLRPVLRRWSDVHLACGELAGIWMYNNENFTIIPNCIDTNKYQYTPKEREKIRKIFSISPNDFLMGHVGGFNAGKNQIFLVKMLYDFHLKGYKNVKLMLIGRGNLRESVEKEAVRLGVKDSVFFTGQREDVHQLLMAFDVFCLPSLYEGFPIVSVEAQASGLPTFVSSTITDEICITNLVRHLPIDQGFDAWEKAILDVMGKQVDRVSYAKNVKDAGYDICKSAKMLEKIYKEGEA